MGTKIKTATNSVATAFGWVVVTVGVLLVLANMAQGLLGGKNPQTPLAERAWRSARTNLCVQEQALANAKLADYFDGFMELSDNDIIRLKNKMEENCYQHLENDFQ